jgi:putative transcriptional regulator
MNLDQFFEQINFEQTAPAKGKVLISEPFMQDPNFARSVILIAEHSDEGTMGFVLNHASEMHVEDVLMEEKDIDAPLYFGGPVGDNQLFYIHTLGPDMLPGSLPILDGLWWGGDFDKLIFFWQNDMIRSNQVRFFAGYSGWAPEQLSGEIKERSWIVSDFTAELAMQSSHDYWTKMMSRLGSQFKLMTQFPEDPSLN